MTEPIVLTLPADPENLVVARQVAAAVAARCGLSVDRVDDARLVVDEVVTLLIEGGAESIACAFRPTAGHLHAEAIGRHARWPEDHDLAWAVLTALANDLDLAIEFDQVRIVVALDEEPPSLT